MEGGFELPEAKSDISWITKDLVMVSTDFGEGSLTESGYPRIVKLWKRGQPLCEAKEIFQGKQSDVGCWPFTMRSGENKYAIIRQSQTFYEGTYHYVDTDTGKVQALDPQGPPAGGIVCAGFGKAKEGLGNPWPNLFPG